MDPALVDASRRGDLPLLQQLLTQDPLSLDRIQIGGLTDTPLHIAAFHGHLPFVEETLRRCPGLALVLDLRRRSPLHLAASQGHGDVVRALAEASPEMCGVLDVDGRNPFHLAAIQGSETVLTQLAAAGTQAARRRTAAGEGVLDFCVRYDRLDCLKVLLEKIRDPEFVHGKDGDGNNVFHLAIKYRRIQMINYLITEEIKLNINATNAMGLTPLDILLQENNVNDLELRDLLLRAGAMKSDEIFSSRARTDEFAFHNVTELNGQIGHDSQNNIFGNKGWFAKRRDSLIFVASLIAAMAFNAGLTPPGNVWQDHFSKEDIGKVPEISHRAGEAIIAYDYPQLYKLYIRFNTTAYVSSLSIILLLISGLPLRHRRYMWAMQVVMWVTITAMAFTYVYVLLALTPIKDMPSLRQIMVVIVLVWCIMMALVFIGNAMRLIFKWVKKRNADHRAQIQMT